FWIVRFARARSGLGLPEMRDSLCGRNDRDVHPHGAEPVAKTDVSPRMGKTDAPGSGRRSGDLGARDRRTRSGRDSPGEDCHAAKWSRGAGIMAGARSLSKEIWNSRGSPRGALLGAALAK